MRKIFATALAFLFWTIGAVATAASEPKILAESAIVVEASTGRIIYEKNADLEREPASMTKMLTAVLALERLRPLDEIVMSEAAVFTEDNTLNWTTGDRVGARDMINAVLLVSENGGAVALAQAVSGSTSQFADLMNEKARELGCKNSHFANPNGLPNSNHYSTAADMARIAVYCMKNPEFRKIVTTDHSSIRWISPKDKWAELKNTNHLLGKYRGANGIKTGWTQAAGGCLAASAKRGELELITIIMRSTNQDTRFEDATALLNYGFERVRMIKAISRDNVEKTVFVRGGKQGTLRVGISEDLNFPLMAEEDQRLLTVTYELEKIVDADGGIREGDILGEAVLRYDGSPVARVPLIAFENVDEGFSFSSLFVRIAAPLIA